MTRFRTTSQSAGGHSTLELLLAMTLISLIAVLVFDAFVLAYCLSLNDDTCKEAARQASRGPTAEAAKRARAVVDRLTNRASSRFVSVRLVSFDTSVKQNDLENLGLYQGVIDGTVSVETEATPNLPIVSGSMLPQLRLRARHVFPVTHVLRAGEQAKAF